MKEKTQIDAFYMNCEMTKKKRMKIKKNRPIFQLNKELPFTSYCTHVVSNLSLEQLLFSTDVKCAVTKMYLIQVCCSSTSFSSFSVSLGASTPNQIALIFFFLTSYNSFSRYISSWQSLQFSNALTSRCSCLPRFFFVALTTSHR